MVVVLAAAFAGATGVTADQMAYERDANRAVTDVLAEDEFGSLTLVDVRTTVPVVGDGYGVTVVVQRPADTAYPSLAERLRAEVAAHTGRQAPVTVQFVERARAPPDSYAGRDPWYVHARRTAR